MSDKTFKSARGAFNGQIDRFLKHCAGEKLDVRALIGALVVEYGEDRRHHIISIADGRANLDTVLNAALNLHLHCCRLVCEVTGADPDKPEYMRDAHRMIMGYLHQNEDNIHGGEAPGLIIQ